MQAMLETFMKKSSGMELSHILCISQGSPRNRTNGIYVYVYVYV